MIGGRGPALAVLGLAGLLLVIALASGWSGASRLAGRGDDTAAIEAAAAAFVEAYGTFDFRTPHEYMPRLAETTAGELRGAIAASSIEPVAIEQQRSMTAAIESVSVTSLAADTATVSVTTVQHRRWIDAASGRAVEQFVEQRVSSQLVREDGRWLVAEFRLLSEQPVVSRKKGAG